MYSGKGQRGHWVKGSVVSKRNVAEVISIVNRKLKIKNRTNRRPDRDSTDFDPISWTVYLLLFRLYLRYACGDLRPALTFFDVYLRKVNLPSLLFTFATS